MFPGRPLGQGQQARAHWRRAILDAMRFAPEYVRSVLAENFEDAKRLFLAPLMAVHRAHLVMLADRAILSPSDAHRLRLALDRVSLDEVARARFDGSAEDLFFHVNALIEGACSPDLAGRLHTARSRNDIDMTMYRMRLREGVVSLAEEAIALRAVLCELAGDHLETVVALHTHTQPAQPSTIAHYLLAVIEQLERDVLRLRASYAETNRCPLGRLRHQRDPASRSTAT